MDLIERLRREDAAWNDWNEDHPDDAAVTTPQLLLEAAAALEAAREDAERWRHARRILTVEDIEKSQDMFDAFGLEGNEHENRKADAAIDRARGKAGQEVGS
jgi:hypothetical protein